LLSQQVNNITETKNKQQNLHKSQNFCSEKQHPLIAQQKKKRKKKNLINYLKAFTVLKLRQAMFNLSAKNIRLPGNLQSWQTKKLNEIISNIIR
jgi:ribosome assembly protein YihI (activator of Der GTPase)